MEPTDPDRSQEGSEGEAEEGGAAPAAAAAAARAPSPPRRLDAFVSRAAGVSRKQAARIIARGRVAVAGRLARSKGTLVPPGAPVTLDGAPLLPPIAVTHVLLHKPAGVVSSTRDPRDRTVVDLLPDALRAAGLTPAGRLDKDTTGLLILTTDGALIHALTHPRRHVPKRYVALVRGPLARDAPARFLAGVVLADGTRCAPASLRRRETWPHAWAGGAQDTALEAWEITVREGRYHQVKRMIAACGGRVEALHREAVGGLDLPPDLPPGASRPLHPQELARALGYPWPR